MAAPVTNGYGPATAGSITRTPSFAPITPVVKEKVGDVATRLSEVEKIIEDLNLQSATSTARSPTMGDLQQEINSLKKDIEGTRAAQKKQIDDLRSDVKNNVKEEITKTMWAEIEKKITESVEAQVKIEVGQWGQSALTKKFAGGLKSMIQVNSDLHQEAQVIFDNSRSRHENSTLDEQADFETGLSKIKLPNGDVSNIFPRTLKELFSYDEYQLLQLFDEYGLRRLDTHLENLNRFLAFIGLRFSIPEQSLDFLDEPPAYLSPDILESSKEESPPETSSASPPNQGEKKHEAMAEVKPEQGTLAQEPAAVNDNPVQVQTQEKQPDEKHTEERHEAKQDRGGQKPAGVGPATVTRQTSMNQRLQQTALTHSVRSAIRNPLPPPPTQQPNPQGERSSGGERENG
ncbi:hypothetical protein BDM02DRAFT_1014666 [Thelephora ganbajun]|uniref:Uncharacterized protein n=1 Tax=Thelephora ganbajun TaxID=370292 RepID=A0ACB6ZNR8_THEGA|nr:hypothetical protein BDM02DRAFT_1014666 [Thelephora ganbajun]